MTFAIVVNPVAILATIVSLASFDSVRIAVAQTSLILGFDAPIPIHLGIVRFLIQLRAIEVASLHHSHAYLRYIQNYQSYPPTCWPTAALDLTFPTCSLLLLVLRFAPDPRFPILMG